MASHQEPHDNQPLLPESSGVNPKPIATFLIVLTLSTAAVFVIVKAMTWGFDKIDAARAGQRASRMADARPLPPLPRLQGAPEPDPAKPGATRTSMLPLEDMKDYRKKTLEAEEAYGWVAGQEGKEAHLPIEQAIKLIASDPKYALTTKSETAVKDIESAEKMRKQINNADASGGRMIGK